MSSDEEASIHTEGDEDLTEALQQNEELTEETPKDDQDEDKRIVKPKRVVRNPQPKLNQETLQGPRGIAALSTHFERVKFKGRGHEEQDLNVIMKTYEYWCHRLFPKFPFDTCIERLEKLGSKKPVQTHIKRIRFDLMLNDDVVNSSDEETNVDSFVNATSAVSQFDQLTDVIASSPKEPELTTEQLERIRINKERAEKLRQERTRQFQEKVNHSTEILHTSPGHSQEDNLNLPAFDYESNIRGKELIKRSNNKLSRPCENELENEEVFSEETHHVYQKEQEVQEEMVDGDSSIFTQSLQICQDLTSNTINKLDVFNQTSNEASSSAMDVQHSASIIVADMSSTSHVLKGSQDSLVTYRQQNVENKENSSLDNIL